MIANVTICSNKLGTWKPEKKCIPLTLTQLARDNYCSNCCFINLVSHCYWCNYGIAQTMSLLLSHIWWLINCLAEIIWCFLRKCKLYILSKWKPRAWVQSNQKGLHVWIQKVLLFWKLKKSVSHHTLFLSFNQFL